MTLWLAVKAIVVWLLILALAFANAALREAVLVPWIGKVRGLTLSGLILSALVLGVAYLTLPWIGAMRVIELFAVGIGWLVFTLLFRKLPRQADTSKVELPATC